MKIVGPKLAREPHFHETERNRLECIQGIVKPLAQFVTALHISIILSRSFRALLWI
jgi:hypothetical protein